MNNQHDNQWTVPPKIPQVRTRQAHDLCRQIFKNSATQIVKGNDQNGQFHKRLEDWRIDLWKRNYNQTDNDRIDNGNERERGDSSKGINKTARSFSCDDLASRKQCIIRRRAHNLAWVNNSSTSIWRWYCYSLNVLLVTLSSKFVYFI